MTWAAAQVPSCGVHHGAFHGCPSHRAEVHCEGILGVDLALNAVVAFWARPDVLHPLSMLLDDCHTLTEDLSFAVLLDLFSGHVFLFHLVECLQELFLLVFRGTEIVTRLIFLLFDRAFQVVLS